MADIYVATTGNDTTGTGTQGNPYLTLAKADSVVTPGTTVHVAPGAYILPTGPGSGAGLTTNTSGTAIARIRYQSDVTWGALIRCAGVYQIWQNNANDIDIVGFDIASAADVNVRDGIQNQGTSCSIQQCYIHDIPAQNNLGLGGSALTHGNNSGQSCDSIGNICARIGTGTDQTVQGIYHSNFGGHIWNNICYACSGWGIQMYHAATNVTVSNNLCFANANGGIIVSNDGTNGINNINNNTIVTNNIFIHNTNYGLRESGVGDVGNNNIYSNNCFFGNSLGDYGNMVSTSPVVNSVSADPQLVNYQANGSGNYHLSSSSPCINAGISTGAPTIDIDGAARSAKSQIDIGTYYYYATPLPVFYGSDIADVTIATACDMALTTGGIETSVTTTTTGGGGQVYAEVFSQTGTSVGVATIPTTPTGKGWVYKPGSNTFSAGPWTAILTISSAGWGFDSTHGNITLRLFKYSSGVYTALGTMLVSLTTNAKTTYTFHAASVSAVTFGANDLMYVDVWWFDNNSSVGGDNPVIYVSNSATLGVLNDVMVTAAPLITSPTQGISYPSVSSLYGHVILNDAAQVYYRMNEASGAIAFDITRNAFNATLAVVTQLQVGAIAFDGDTAMSLLSAGSLVIPGSIPLASWSVASLEYWQNPGSGWQHIVVTVNGATTTRYTNAVPGVISSITVSGLITWFSNNFSGGLLDEFALYKYILTPQQIANHYYIGTQG